MITQSVGVPLTAKTRSESFRSRNGSCSVSECAAPLWSVSGATTQTSFERSDAIFCRTSRPGASMPSSFVMRIRMPPLHAST